MAAKLQTRQDPMLRLATLRAARHLKVPEDIPAEQRGLGTTLRGVALGLPRINLTGLARLQARLSEATTTHERLHRQRVGREFAQWVDGAMRNGAGVAHRWTREDPKAPPLPAVVHTAAGPLYSPVEKMDHYRRYWQELWGRHGERSALTA